MLQLDADDTELAGETAGAAKAGSLARDETDRIDDSWFWRGLQYTRELRYFMALSKSAKLCWNLYIHQ